MYNTDMPTRAELPSSGQLKRSTLIAAISAAVLLITIVMPADFGIDPTGVGQVLGLTEMGQTKKRLAEEAAADTASVSASASTLAPTRSVGTASTVSPVTGPAAGELKEQAAWKDTMRISLKPGEGSEVKMTMPEGAKARYSWTVESGLVNYDAHGDGGGNSISYKKGRSVAADEGVLSAAFSGKHGWFWRNRGESDVTVVLSTTGEYSEIKKMK